MEKLTVVSAVIGTSLIFLIAMAVDFEAVIAMITDYDIRYLFGQMFGQFVLFLLVFWVIEKVYFKIKPKKGKSRVGENL